MSGTKDVLESCQRIEVDDGSGDGHKRGVETVEHASMTWQDVARVLDAKGALEEALDEIAPSAEDDDDQS